MTRAIDKRRPELAAELDRAAELADQRIATSSRDAYASDWRAFTTWAAKRRRSPAIPVSVQTCAAWLASMERDGLAPATIERRAVGLAHAHREHGCKSPTHHPKIRDLLAGIRRVHRSRPRARKRPLSPSMIRAAVHELGVRDRAIVLAAYSSAARRSELAAATWADLELVADGLILNVRASKNDPHGKGHTIAILRTKDPSVCPVRALRRLRTATAIDRGLEDVPATATIFGCSDRTIARVIKRAAELAGEDPAQFGGHSTRAGSITAAAEAGIPEHQIREHTGHRSDVLRVYIRPIEARRNPATKAIADSLSDSEPDR